MSEIRDKVRKKIAWYLTNQFIGNPKEFPDDECLGEADKILSIPEIAIVDREAKVPQRQKLPKGHLLLEAEDKNDIYLNGQIFAQEKMLEEGWLKGIKED